MDAITYAAASQKVFNLDLGEIEKIPSQAEIPLSDKQNQELEGLIKSGKPFILKLSAIVEGESFNGMNRMDMFFLHSAIGFFYTIFFGMTFIIGCNIETKELFFTQSQPSSSSSTYSPRSETPTFKELFEMLQESAIERGLIK